MAMVTSGFTGGKGSIGRARVSGDASAPGSEGAVVRRCGPSRSARFVQLPSRWGRWRSARRQARQVPASSRGVARGPHGGQPQRPSPRRLAASRPAARNRGRARPDARAWIRVEASRVARPGGAAAPLAGALGQDPWRARAHPDREAGSLSGSAGPLAARRARRPRASTRCEARRRRARQRSALLAVPARAARARRAGRRGARLPRRMEHAAHRATR